MKTGVLMLKIQLRITEINNILNILNKKQFFKSVIIFYNITIFTVFLTT